jgi:uncharacterized protein (TIGR03000 family)
VGDAFGSAAPAPQRVPRSAAQMQRFRPMMLSPAQMARIRDRRRAFQRMLLSAYLAGVGSSSAYQMPYSLSGSYQMPYGGYGGYRRPSGGDGSSSSATSTGSKLPGAPTADDVEVSGPLEVPPPRRGIIRLRLPNNWASVSIDGRKIDEFGKRRTYVTPELAEPRTFEVAATWDHNGRTSRLQEKVTVQAGQIRTLDFTSAD